MYIIHEHLFYFVDIGPMRSWKRRIELYFDHNHNVIYIQCKYTLTEYNKYIIVTVEILLKPQGAYNEDHQDMKNRH